MRRRVAGLAIAVLALAATVARAQTGSAGAGSVATPARAAGAPRAERVEVSCGASWAGGYDLGSRDAVLTGNPGTSGGKVVLFRAASEVSGYAAVDVRVGVGLTRALVVDAGFAYGRPELRVRVSDDFEQAAEATVTDAIAQYVFEGGLRYHFGGWSGTPASWSPFVSGGVGYLRQLASEAATVEDGVLVHAGGGVAWRLGGSPRRAVRGYGLRAEARVNWRASGIDVEDAARVYPSAGASFYLRF